MDKIITAYANFTINRALKEYEGKLFMEQAYTYLPDLDAPHIPYVEPVYDSDDDGIEFIIEPELIIKTCLCTNIVGVKKVCLRQTCTFAHTVDEWSPTKCGFGARCRNKSKCQRLHPSGVPGAHATHHGTETKAAAIERLGIVFLSPKKYANTRLHIMIAAQDPSKKSWKEK